MAGLPDTPWNGSCESKDCKGSREDAKQPRSPIRPGRQDKASRAQDRRPQSLWVADFIYVHTAMVMAYAAFVIGLFKTKVVKHLSPSKTTPRKGPNFGRR